MSYKYSFDTRQVGTTWFWRNTFEFLIKGLTRLRDLLEAWNKSEDVPPYVDLPEALVARLRRRQSISEAEATVAGREPSSWVFPAPSDDTKPLNAAFLRFKVWYRLLRRAEVRLIRIHDLRHTYASLLLLAGEPMLYVKEQLGHSTVQVTVDFYGHIRPGLNRGAFNRLAEATRPGAPAVELHSDYTSERR